MLRKSLFWLHLIVGVCAGVIIFIMSATGVLLTYEKQINDWDQARHKVVDSQGQKRQSIDNILKFIKEKHPEEHHIYIRKFHDEARAIPVWAGNHRYLLSPYSGEVIETGLSLIGEVMHFVTDLHRWLAMELEEESFAKEVTAYSNLCFLFLILTGIYIWLPRRYRWPLLKSQLFFKADCKSKHAKHFNWHHVFGFWAIIPLFVIVSTATIFHFKWANQIIYSVYGEETPAPRTYPKIAAALASKPNYEYLFSVAQQYAENNAAKDWYSMWLEFDEESNQVRFYIDRSLGNQPSAAFSLHLDINTSSVVKVKYHSDWSKGDQAWDVARYLHTGEYFGIIGQTIAGLASLAACFLVYTGFTLSWRRLISPYLRRTN